MDDATRAAVTKAAVDAAKAVSYVGAGTVEFIADASQGLKPDRIWFMEMNTRLQVEHPVTELVTGLDLVRAQIAVAQGEPLPPAFHDVQPRGHAIEVRLYAEDPYRNFAPSPGRIDLLRWPQGPGVRNDVGVYEGGEVPIHYDPMLGKLIVWGEDRTQALDRLGRALAELRIEGVATSVPLFLALLRDEEFRNGAFDIAWLDRKLKAGELVLPVHAVDRDLPFVAAALAELERGGRAAAAPPAESARSRWSVAARREALRNSGGAT